MLETAKQIAKAVLPMRVRSAVRVLLDPNVDAPPHISSDDIYHHPQLSETAHNGLRCVIDVGANDGSFGIDIARRHPGLRVFAFEPTPVLIEKIRDRVADLPNYELIGAAVSNEAGKATFNVAGNADWGCSSLMRFSSGLDQKWPGRSDFKVTDFQEVPVIRLDDFVRQRGIAEIAYLHVDAQGSDLNVLQSLGEFIDIVEQGCVEAASSRSVALYDGAPSLAEVIPYLSENKFEVLRLLPNDVFYNEVNVHFRRAQPVSNRAITR